MVKVKGLHRSGGGHLAALLIVWCSLVCLPLVASVEGEPCRFQKGPGVCIGYSTCRPLLEALNGRITICSYNSREAVVCCPQDYQSQLKTLAAAQQGLTISAKKCIEYMRLATPTTIFSSLKPNAEVVQKKSKLCSIDNNLIVGGEAAKLNEFPHMGAIGYRNNDTGRVEFRCGATLISERYVLTAAHCRNADAVVVRLGDLDLDSDVDGANPRDFQIEEFIKHPQYMSRSKYNDIALVRLAAPVQINNRIRPACLYQSAEIQQQKLIATGYGAMENFGSNANTLMKVVLEQYSQEACQAAYKNEGRFGGIIESQFCAGYEDGGRDTCQGDSGGPLQVRDEQDSCRFYVAAITSFGKFCGTSTPGIYTRVGAYLGWIEQIVWGEGGNATSARKAV
uniref:Putative trypsin-like serine protease n=1 Tax=Culex tarsalis TaxID=7177 RepID=A0A1Q3FBM8_CULTA